MWSQREVKDATAEIFWQVFGLKMGIFNLSKMILYYDGTNVVKYIYQKEKRKEKETTNKFKALKCIQRCDKLVRCCNLDKIHSTDVLYMQTYMKSYGQQNKTIMLKYQWIQFLHVLIQQFNKTTHFSLLAAKDNWKSLMRSVLRNVLFSFLQGYMAQKQVVTCCARYRRHKDNKNSKPQKWLQDTATEATQT